MKEYIDVDTLGEIYLERERYLLNIDELLEEMHSKADSGITAYNTGYYTDNILQCIG